ncbi:CvpA family protein [Alkalitalea saponilacus]|uniref:Membrane protein required for colicin V production n=1 Tax=Alkalitalea saponilacus TaxID=889453 RepID=A0A1T5HTH7_9BACT|nr:CvpA family protein [Alkalitalea saponilacus]ASB49179.1 colicin V production protein [Alkalitalea saponilacus]SKC23997.1 membrane protein required for colicin V production [Alkalitalea saponilacus]
MHIFDIIALIIILFFLFKGLKNGFIIELASLAALFLGIILAVMFSEVTATWLSDYITSRYVSILAFILVFTATVLGVHLVAKMIDKLVSAIALGWLNRLTGAAFGVVKAAILISIGILLFEATGLSEKYMTAENRENSLLYSHLQKAAPHALHLINLSVDHLLPRLEELPVMPPASMS